MRKLCQMCLLYVFCACGLVVRGQTIHSSFYANLNGDIWKYDLAQSSATQLTHSGYNGGPILSPDRTSFAYLETAPTFLARYKAGAASQTAGAPPVDIWLYDISSQTFTRIADQTGASPGGFLRSIPTWSPDSRQLAWLQIDPYVQPTDRASLRIYNLDTGLTAGLAEDVNLGDQESHIRMPIARWGDGGIARLFLISRHDSRSPFLFLEIIDPASGSRTQYNLELLADNSNLARDFMWANHQGRAVLLLGIRDYWDVLDPLDGSRNRLSDPPRLKNSLAPGGMELVPLAIEGASGEVEFHWRAFSGGIAYDTGYRSSDVDWDGLPTLASGGRQMAWHGGDRISMWHTGIAADARPLASDSPAYRLFPIPEPMSVAWAPMQWVTTGATVSSQSAPAVCSRSPRLILGQQAIVSPGLANRIRSAPSLNATIVGRIQENEVVDVLEGPICGDGYNWYRVQNNRISGWSAEGIADEYWLLYHVDCPHSPPTRLAIGMTAVVTPGKANLIRDGVGASSANIVGRMEAGSAFVITGHPQCDADGMRWYPIQFGQIRGWTAAGSGGDYWIAPAVVQAAG